MNPLGAKYRPLLVAAFALIALPFAMRLLGLSHRDGLEYHPESYGILRLSQGSETFFAA